jgi:hypothetical protein
VFPKEGSFSAVVDENTRQFLTLVSATLTILGSVIAYRLTESLSTSQSWGIVLAWMAAGLVVTYLLSRVQARSQEESPEAIKRRVGRLESELRKRVQARSYGARRNLIEAPLKELDLDITPRVDWVRDPRLVEPEPISEKTADIVAAFASSKRRLLIVGEPGSGKTMAAYSLIELLDESEGDEGRIPLLVNLSAWEAQENVEAFLVDYLCSSVGYEVRERAVAGAFISSYRYALILDGLDEIPVMLRQHFSERLDEFVRGLTGEVAVVVTCRTQEYEELKKTYSEGEGLGLVQAVEILPLTEQQLDSAFIELAKRDKEWESFLSQRHATAYQRVRQLLSNPLFLNLAVVGRLRPDELLDSTTTEQELRDFLLDRYLGRALADQRQYAAADARRYLTWVARFLDGAEASPFGLKTSDATVFDLANLTPPKPPRGYRWFMALSGAASVGVLWGLFAPKSVGGTDALIVGIPLGLVWALVGLWPNKRSAVRSRLTFVWPSTRQRLRNFFTKAGRGLAWGTVWGAAGGVVATVVWGVAEGRMAEGENALLFLLLTALVIGIMFGLPLGLIVGLGRGLVESRSLLITTRTPKEAISNSLKATFVWLGFGLVAGLTVGLVFGVYGLFRLEATLVESLLAVLIYGLPWGLLVGVVGG